MQPLFDSREQAVVCTGVSDTDPPHRLGLAGGALIESRYTSAIVAQPIGISSAAHSGTVAGAIRDTVLIALGWLILIGVVLFPAAQLVGIFTCAVALAVGKPRADGTASSQEV
jgi:hypothetical protein